tara:strand:- start:396 stop:1046 length:651 start_codon:yes stop_codon:yes gene_type:complete
MPRKQSSTTSGPAQKRKGARKAPAVKAAAVKVKAEKPAPTKAEVAPTPAPVAASTPEVTPVLSPELAAEFSSIHTQLQQAQALISSLRSSARTLERKATRELKAAQKAQQKRKRRAGNRSPSGFVKPTLISNELAAFLGKDKGTEMARTEVTREINAYIRANNLQDKDNGRKINADTKLTKLLKLNASDELTYFNLQKYMSPHFAKAGASVVATSS